MGNKSSKPKTWKYHVSHSFEINGESINLVTQLYSTGVYAIINGNPGMQLSFNPADIVKLEKNILAEEKAGKIKNLKFGRQITVTTEAGFFVEMK